MSQEFDCSWKERTQAIFLKLRNRYSFEGQFYMLSVVEYLISNSKFDEAREKFSCLIYCAEKHLDLHEVDDTLLDLYQSRAILDLKVHIRPFTIDQSKLYYYMDKVDEYLIDEKCGYSSWFFEANSQGDVIRQVLKFDNMPYQQYSYAYFENDKGGLTTHKLEDEYKKSLLNIDQIYFEKMWNNYLNG